jgi:hypothetical protein
MGRLLLAIALVAGLILPGCARIDKLRGKTPPPTREAFVAEAEKLCVASTARMVELGVHELDQDLPPNGDVGRLRIALRTRREGYLEVRDLDTPDGAGDVVRAFVDAAVVGIDQLVERTRARERGDTAGERTARDRSVNALAKARKLGAAIGFTACLP